MKISTAITVNDQDAGANETVNRRFSCGFSVCEFGSPRRWRTTFCPNPVYAGGVIVVPAREVCAVQNVEFGASE